MKSTFKALFLGIISLIGVAFNGLAQSKIYSLEEIMNLARKQSPRALQAKTLFTSRYWQFRTYKSNYLPQLGLSTVSGDYFRSIDNILQPDGSFAFRPREVASSTATLGLSQNIGLTGGSVFVNSSISRVDNFNNKTINYQTVPLSIGISQPLLSYNALRWDRKIAPIQYEEAKRQYNEDMERVGLVAAQLYFQLLQAQFNLQVSQFNVANNDTLYKLSQGRYSLGKIAENELLQMELALIRSRQQLNQSVQDVRQRGLELRRHLGMTEDAALSLEVPNIVLPISVKPELAISEARANRAIILGFERRKLQAEQQVSQARGETGLRGSLRANLGVNQQAGELSQAYINPQSQQQIALELSTPILDWGRTRSRRKTAMANRDYEQSVIQQELLTFDQSIEVAVQQYEFSNAQLNIARRSNEVANKRYEIAKQRYLIGKIAITDLNIAQQERDQSQQSFFEALRSYTLSYLDLRTLTLFDFEKQQKIAWEYEE